MFSNLSPIKRVLIIALISGLFSGIIVTGLIWFVFATAWFFFIIPAVMGWAIKQFANIKASEVEADPMLERNVGWLCAGIVLAFVIITALLSAWVAYMVTGTYWGIFLNIIFYIASAFAVWYGYKRGSQAVVDSYYDSNLAED